MAALHTIHTTTQQSEIAPPACLEAVQPSDADLHRGGGIAVPLALWSSLVCGGRPGDAADHRVE